MTLSFHQKEGQNRQELKDVYIPNGAIYLFKKENLIKNTIKGQKIIGNDYAKRIECKY